MPEVLTDIPSQTQEVINQIPHDGIKNTLIKGLVELEFIDNHHQIEDEVFEPSFVGDSERVQAHMHDISETMRAIHDGAPKEATYAELDRFVWRGASQSFVARAVEAKATGNEDMANDAILSGLIVSGIAERYEDGIYPNTKDDAVTEFIHRAVGNNLADNIVSAVQMAYGLVIVKPEYDFVGEEAPGSVSKVVPLAETIRPNMPMLEIACGKNLEVEGAEILSRGTFDEHRLARTAESLTVSELATVTAVDRMSRDPEARAKIIKASIDRAKKAAVASDYSVNDAELDSFADDVIKMHEAAPELFESGLDEQFADILLARDVNNKYRINNQASFKLDKAVLELWAKGYKDIARKMISIGREVVDAEGGDGVLRHAGGMVRRIDTRDIEAALIEIGSEVSDRENALYATIADFRRDLRPAAIAEPSNNPANFVVDSALSHDVVAARRNPELYVQKTMQCLPVLKEIFERFPVLGETMNSRGAANFEERVRLLVTDDVQAFLQDEELGSIAFELFPSQPTQLPFFEMAAGLYQEGMNSAEFARELIKNDAATFAAHVHLFDDMDSAIDSELVQEIIDSGKLESVSDVLEICRKNVSKEMQRNNPDIFHTNDIFGAFGNADTFLIVRNLLKGEIDPDSATSLMLQELGVNEVGEPGLNQLKHSFTSLRKDIINGDEDALRRVLDSGGAMLLPLLKQIVNYSESQWGSHDMDSMRNTLLISLGLEASVRETQLLPSGTVEVSRVGTKDKMAEREIKWNEDEVAKFNKLVDWLGEAATLLEGPKPFSRGVEMIQSYVQRKTTDLENKLVTLADKPKAVSKIREQLELLPEFSSLRSLAEFETNFLALSQDRKTHDIMAPLLFAWAIARNPNTTNREEVAETIQKIKDLTASRKEEGPTLSEAAFVNELVDHVINQEVYSNYFESKAARDAFADMVSIGSLQKGMQRVQGAGPKTGVARLKYGPTRGPLMEFSGHIGDACWANKYGSMAEEFPNMTAVTISQRPDKPDESLVGSFFFIEAGSSDGDLLIVRGLNPRENIINTLDIQEFYDSIVEYAQQEADRLGKRAAIVIDNHSGGSATNRPVLYGFLASQKQHMAQANGLDVRETTFNGYNITGDTYLL